jgi:hypothetical protein
MLTPAYIAATIQGHARRLGIEKLIATKDEDTHVFHNLGEGKIWMTDLPVINPWPQIFSAPVTGLST